MPYQLRPYQQEAADRAVEFMTSQSKGNGLIVAPTGCGKSLMIAETAYRMNSDVIVFSPSAEIVRQNYEKMLSYGVTDCAIYSASCHSKEIARITFATIGSVANHMEFFRHFRYVIVDEAHLVNSLGGRYAEFFEDAERRIIGLTATPYRLSGALVGLDENGNPNMNIEPQNYSILKFLTRTRPKIFTHLLYSINPCDLFRQGFLSKMEYFDLTAIDERNIERNGCGTYVEKSLQREFRRVSLAQQLAEITQRVIHPKNGKVRQGVLVFTQFVDEAVELAQTVEGVAVLTGATPAKERERLIAAFKAGVIKVLANVGVLTVGFDYPALDTVIVARPTMSLALWMQICGRAIRPHPSKEAGWVIDLCGNLRRFGRLEDTYIAYEGKSRLPCVCGIVGGVPTKLTNRYF